MTKKEIRENMKLQKSMLTMEQVIEYSDMIFHKLKETISMKYYDAIYTYVAFNEEIQTQSIIEFAFCNHIKVAVPKIENKKMDFYYINQMEDLKPGFYDILEPTTTLKATDNHILMIMPGLAFDMECNRIGYGAGYYDKYLEENGHLLIDKIALTFDFQLIDSIETKSYDIKVDHIITPTRIIHRRSE